MLHPSRWLVVLGSMFSLASLAQPQPPPRPAPPADVSRLSPILQPLVVPPPLQGREAKARAVLMRRHGLKPEADAAVARALRWLKEQQNPIGCWGETNRGAMTGLAVLAYLGHGETPDSPEFGLTVAKAIQWALDKGHRTNGRLHMGDAFDRNSDVYEHGILTFAVAEYYAMTKDERVQELLVAALKFILDGQGPGGGWMYNYDRTANDLSVSGWQMQALASAHLAGFQGPRIEKALNDGIVYLDRVRGPRGGYGYRGPEDRYTLTGAGVFCRLLWKGRRDAVSKGVEFILEETAQNKPVRYLSESADLYAWYYHTHALFAYGGQAWGQWRDSYQNELLAAQIADGSWPPPGGKGFGLQTADTVEGALYRTNLCALMLEAPYRYIWPAKF